MFNLVLIPGLPVLHFYLFVAVYLPACLQLLLMQNYGYTLLMTILAVSHMGYFLYRQSAVKMVRITAEAQVQLTLTDQQTSQSAVILPQTRLLPYAARLVCRLQTGKRYTVILEKRNLHCDDWRRLNIFLRIYQGCK